MKNLHIIMPMAGEGQRFKDAGYDIPKPLIEVGGKPLYKRAIESITNNVTGLKFKYTFIVRKEFQTDYNIDKYILNDYPSANIILIEKTTSGSLESAFLSYQYIDEDNDSIMIIDCDIEFNCKEYYNELIKQFSSIDNITTPLLLSFYSHDSRYSYAYTSNNGLFAIATAEKIPISSYALSGCYFLGDAKYFIKYAKMLIDDFYLNKLDAKECYVSLLYNYLFKYEFKQIRIIDFNQHIDALKSYGTPEEMEFTINNKYNNIWDRK